MCGVYRIRQRIPSYEELKQKAKNYMPVFYRDGIDASIAVQELLPERTERLLSINGKVDASTVSDLLTQKMLGHIPMIIHTNAKDVLIIGIGSGATIGAVLTYNVKHVDVIEISKDVIEASQYFATVNRQYWKDSRVKIIWEDAKTFLQITNKKYDLIISEPTNPWIAGVAGVFSKEYFTECSKHLKDNGLFIQWIQAYEIEDPTFYLIVETFTEHFPFFTIWNPMRTDTIFAGSKQAYFPNFEHINKIFEEKETANDFLLTQINSPLILLSMQMCDYARSYSHIKWIGAVNSDFFPILEYIAPRGFFVGSPANGAKLIDQRWKSPLNAKLWINEYLRKNKPLSDEFNKLYKFVASRYSLFDRISLAAANLWFSNYPADISSQYAAAEQKPPDYQNLQTIFKTTKKEKLTYEQRKFICRKLFADYAFSRSFVFLPQNTTQLMDEIESLISTEKGKTDWELYRWHGEICYDTGNYSAAEKSLENTLQLLKGNASYANEFFETAILLCECLTTNGKNEIALSKFQQYLSNSFQFNLKARIIYNQLLLYNSKNL